MSVAEAQSLTALRAEIKGSSNAVIASLHVGASDGFETASKVLKQNTGGFNTVSSYLRRFLAINSSLEACRAYQYMAQDLLAKNDAGQAVACCKEAHLYLQDCVTVSESDPVWVKALDAEAARLWDVRTKCDNVRTAVLFQRVPQSAPSLVEGKILAKPSEFKPEEHRKRNSS